MNGVKIRMVRSVFCLGMIVFLGLTTWPGVYSINRVKPLVIGLPFNLFAIALLIVVALGLLTALYLSEDHSGDE